MRKTSFLCGACAALLLSVGCDAAMNDETLDDQTASGRDQTPAGTTDRMSTGAVQNFVQQAAIGNMAEVELGQLASQRAQNAEVKKFAQRMVQDHTTALNGLKSAASGLSANLPSSLDQKHQQLHQRLSGLQGAEFDREYMDAMVDAHEEMVSLLEDRAGDTGRGAEPGAASPSNAQTGGDDAALNQWAAKNLPIVQEHLEQAKQIQERLENQQ